MLSHGRACTELKQRSSHVTVVSSVFHCISMCSVFFISHDDRFMIKTMHKEEIKLLLRCGATLLAFPEERDRKSVSLSGWACLPAHGSRTLPAYMPLMQQRSPLAAEGTQQ